MSAGRLTVEKKGAVGWIVFDQPEKKNAINGAMWRGIPEAMARFDADAEVRCVAFRGAGSEAFAAGADISEFAKVRADRAAVGQYDGLLDRVLHSIQDSRKPSVALIHGFCMGGGLEVALACDLRYCGTSAQFAIPAAKLGLGYGFLGRQVQVFVDGQEILSITGSDEIEEYAQLLGTKMLAGSSMDAQEVTVRVVVDGGPPR